MRTKRKVIQLDLSGNFIKEYESILSAAKENNLAYSNIFFCCSGKIKISGGFRWIYESDYKNIKQFNYDELNNFIEYIKDKGNIDFDDLNKVIDFYNDLEDCCLINVGSGNKSHIDLEDMWKIIFEENNKNLKKLKVS